MGKKKGYNVAEMDLKPEEKKKETKESFTVQDYDTITNDMMNEQHSKQLDAEDSDEGEIDDDDSSSNSYQSETQAVYSVFYKKDSVHDDQPKKDVKNQSMRAEHDRKETNEIETSSNEEDSVDDHKLEENYNNQSTKVEDGIKKKSGGGTSKKHQCPPENSNLKAAEQYTSIDLGEIKHAPTNSPIKNCFKRNLRCIQIGIAVVVGLIIIVIISIVASRKQHTLENRSNGTNGTIEVIEARNPKAYFNPDNDPEMREQGTDVSTLTSSPKIIGAYNHDNSIVLEEFKEEPPLNPMSNENAINGTNVDSLSSRSNHETGISIAVDVTPTEVTNTAHPKPDVIPVDDQDGSSGSRKSSNDNDAE